MFTFGKSTLRNPKLELGKSRQETNLGQLRLERHAQDPTYFRSSNPKFRKPDQILPQPFKFPAYIYHGGLHSRVDLLCANPCSDST